MRLANVKFHGEEFQIRMPNLAYFIFGIRKSGSTLLNEAAAYLAQRNDVNWVSFPDKLFLKNIDFENEHRCKIPDELIHPGNIYAGFRTFPRSLLSNNHFTQGKKILLVRDPRDALVSQYFSFAASHYLPDGSDETGPRQMLLRVRKELQNLSIDEFVLREAKPMNDTMLSYRAILGDKGTLVLRYEDIIFEKRKFLLSICDHFQWRIVERDLSDILHHIDVLPDAEDVEKFIRKAAPGDHIDKLRQETIEELDGILSEAMSVFGYRSERRTKDGHMRNGARIARRSASAQGVG